MNSFQRLIQTRKAGVSFATTAIDIDLVDFNFQKHAIITRLFGIGGGTQEVIAQKVDGVTIDEHEIKNIELEFSDISRA